jgi:polyribonucleotide nucleotidyltransferase
MEVVMHHIVKFDLNGKEITLETGKIAKQADGSVVVSHGQSVVLVTAVSGKKAREGVSFFPLSVDYREYTYSVGRIPGGYIKREGRLSEKETLTCRLIDRPIRPLFPEGYKHDTQIVALILSADPTFDPAPLAMIGAGAALAISDIPFHHNVCGMRICMDQDGKMTPIPLYDQQKAAKFVITVAGTDEGIVMVEAGGRDATEDEVMQCIDYGHKCCQTVNKAVRELTKLAGKKKREFVSPKLNDEIMKKVSAAVRTDLTDALDTKKYGKLESYAKIDALEAASKALFTEEAEIKEAGHCFHALKETIFRDEILKKKHRPDHRKFDQIRALDMETSVLPRTHGSSLFTRGETQALVTTTLGTKDDEQRLEGLDITESTRRFMLHYNFPPFSVGETGRMGAPGRREIGHGALAERALAAVLPDEKDFGYTIRIVSDILESNGSSSMASVCGGSMALMDAGVPVRAAVAGIAMGLVKEGDDYAILTDIAGAEDHYGDMDFKVAGTEVGINALQMDLKVPNVSLELMREALAQAKDARLFLLGEMNKVIDKPREKMSDYAPRIYTTKIPTDKIREIIGPGGKMIRSICDTAQVKIDVSDDGTVNIFAVEAKNAEKALAMIGEIVRVAEIGKTYLGTVVRIADFGAFVEIFAGTDGLLHISEISDNRVKSVRDELNEGDQILVKCLAIEGNKIKLSRKAVLQEQREKLQAAKKAKENKDVEPKDED